MELSSAYALAASCDEAVAIRDEVAFFQTVKTAVVKTSLSASGRTEVDVEHAIRQLISQAIVTDGVIDVFAAAGLKKPELSILSDEFLAEVRALPQKNLAVELLRKLLNDELKLRRRTNLVQSEALSTKLEKNELAFYDALETNDSAVAVLGDAVLILIARELTASIRASVTIDWTQKETVRAQLRTLVRRKLRQRGYPPEKTEKAVDTVIKQAELPAARWAE